MAVKFGAAFGCEVTVISTSPGKEAEAKAMGATHFLISTDKGAMDAGAGSLDGIIDTVSGGHDVAMYMNLLDVHGKFVMVGAAPDPFTLASFPLIFGNKSLIGSLIGGVPITQKMLDFCGEKNVRSLTRRPGPLCRRQLTPSPALPPTGHLRDRDHPH